MPGLILNFAETNRIFRPDGKVVVVAPDNSEQERGKWSSASAVDANRIRYTFDDAGQDDFDVSYSFNENNQLVATVPAAANGGQDSAAFVFAGRIKIDDNQDVGYELFDDAGNYTGASIVVHGELGFVQLDRLTVTLPDKRTIEILGDDDTGRTNLEPRQSAIAGQSADLINFSATTYNTINEEERATRAIILFTGNWGFNDKGLVFSAGLTPGAMKIQFGGTYKGVTAGLNYYAGDGEEELAFTIHGTHQFQTPKGGAGSVNWLMTLGYSNQEINAVAQLKIASQTPAGNKLTLAGDFQFVAQPGQGTPPKTSLSLEATYQTKGSQLIFAADFQTIAGRPSYNLRFDGTYQLRNGQVTFAVQFQNTPDAGQQLKINLGTVSNRNLQAHLAAVVSKTPAGKIDYSLNFDIKAQWINGDLMKIEAPTPA
jgi:hypothetical protein